MSLADHYNENGGQSYLAEGQHEVTIKTLKRFVANSGNKGVEFQLQDDSGAVAKVGFILTPKALWTLANFAKAAGLSLAEMRSYDAENDKGHEILLNRRVGVIVHKVGQYHETKNDEFFPAGSAAQKPLNSKLTEHAMAAASAAPVRDDDIPF